MAEQKQSFVLYADMIHMVEKLTDVKAGKLLKIILRYVNDKDPVVDDLLLQIAFEPIKRQLKRDLVKYENFKNRQSENGKKGGRPKTQINPKNPSLLKKTQKSPNDNVNDSDNDNDSVMDLHAPDILKSNLFREPNVPTLDEVKESFSKNGGNDQMAEKFFNKYNSTAWYLNGSPIKDFNSLVYGFIDNWNKNEKNGNKKSTSYPGKVFVADQL